VLLAGANQQPLIGCKLLLLWCCLLAAATSLLSLFFPLLTAAHWCLNVSLPMWCYFFGLACLSLAWCSCLQQRLLLAVGCCLSSLACWLLPKAAHWCFNVFQVLLLAAKTSIGCRLLLLVAVISPLSLVLPKISTIKELWQVWKVHQSSFRLQDFKLGSNSTKR
jgi:hypothetical protein